CWLGPRPVFAVEPDVQEDRAACDRGQDERRPLADADRDPAEQHVEEEAERPEEGRDPLVDAGWAKVERHRAASLSRSSAVDVEVDDISPGFSTGGDPGCGKC